MATYNKAQLALAILNAMDTAAQATADSDPAQGRKNIADAIAEGIDTYIRTVIGTVQANVTVTAPPSTINVVGSPSAQTNVSPITISGTGTLQ